MNEKLGAIMGGFLKRANVADRDINFSVGSTYGSASGVLRIVYDENSGYLTSQIISGQMDIVNAGEYLEEGYLRFRYTFQSAAFPLQKYGTTGPNAISGAPNILADTVPDYDVTITLHVNIIVSAGGSTISEGNTYITL